MLSYVIILSYIIYLLTSSTMSHFKFVLCLKGHSHRAFLQLLSCRIRQLSAGFEICSIFLAFFCFFIKIEHVEYFLPKGQQKAG